MKLKSFAKSSMLQPVLTVILIVMLIILAVQFFGRTGLGKNDQALRQLSRKVTFEEAVDRYMNGSYESYTRGSLIVKNSQNASSDGNKTIDPQKSGGSESSVLNATENKYDDMFFILDKGVVKRLELKSYGQNESLFFNQKGEIVFLSNTDKSYAVYPIPADDEKDANLLFDSTKQLLQDTYPLVALIRDYKDGKFNPVERATNVYSGKWKHPLFTSDEIVDVFIETEPTNGLFSSINIVHSFTTTPSRIFFDFKPYQNIDSAFNIPGGYKQTDLKLKYKAKS